MRQHSFQRREGFVIPLSGFDNQSLMSRVVVYAPNYAPLLLQINCKSYNVKVRIITINTSNSLKVFH
jgi:hypothetical protein